MGLRSPCSHSHPPVPVSPTHRASTSAALSLATSLLRWRWLSCFLALSSSFTVSSSSACAFCSLSMPCGERQPGGDSCPHCPGTGDMCSPPGYLLERPLLGEAGAAGGLGCQGTVALGGGDTDLPCMCCPLDDAPPDSGHAPVGTGVAQARVLPAPRQLFGDAQQGHQHPQAQQGPGVGDMAPTGASR